MARPALPSLAAHSPRGPTEVAPTSSPPHTPPRAPHNAYSTPLLTAWSQRGHANDFNGQPSSPTVLPRSAVTQLVADAPGPRTVRARLVARRSWGQTGPGPVSGQLRRLISPHALGALVQRAGERGATGYGASFGEHGPEMRPLVIPVLCCYSLA